MEAGTQLGSLARAGGGPKGQGQGQHRDLLTCTSGIAPLKLWR